jgi:transcriptional regulator PpsR
MATKSLDYRIVDPFKAPARSVGNLDAEIVANLLASAADVALVVSQDGIIQDVAFGTGQNSGFEFPSWLGVRWVDTVMPDSKHKVEELLSGACSKSPTRWREINHITLSGEQVPVRYSALQARDDGSVIALGHNLRSAAALQARLVDAQMSIEAEYARLRRTELRYRLLFQTASEATLIVDAITGMVVEANPAAWGILGESSEVPVLHRVHDLFFKKDACVIDDLLSAAPPAKAASSIKCRVARTGTEVLISRASFRQGSDAYTVLRLVPLSDSNE